jgi:peptidoglycan-associated lipoprotein
LEDISWTNCFITITIPWFFKRGDLMKMNNVATALLSASICLALLTGSGCSKKTVDMPGTVGAGGSMSGGTDINYPPADGTGYSESTLGSQGSLDDTSSGQGGNTSGLSVNADGTEKSDSYKMEHGRSSMGLSPIYFNYDQATVRQDMGDRMSNNALFLNQLPGSKVVIEGNCDDRGTNEYNLALGQRRALNAQEYLINLGVGTDRIRTVSYGEERPLFLGQDETSFAQNRRVDFVLE